MREVVSEWDHIILRKYQIHNRNEFHIKTRKVWEYYGIQ